MFHALHSVCQSHALLQHRQRSRNNRKMLKISYIKGKYLGNRYLPLIFCACSARSKCRIRCRKRGKCFPKIRGMFPKNQCLFSKNNRVLEFSNKTVASAVSEDTGAAMAELHSCHNVTKKQLADKITYLDLMTQNYPYRILV